MKAQSLLLLASIILLNFLMGLKVKAQVNVKSPVDPVITQAPKPKQVYTLAFIVGVSEYDQINGLKYADKDARDFKAYLQSKAGGSVPDSNIVMLTNEDATFERVVNQLEWLKASALSNKIDTNKYQIKVILFFSSHGYEDKIVYKQDTATHGILCLHDTSPGYKDRFLALPFLKDYAEDVAFLKKKVAVNLYIDACRSGALISRTQSSILKEELYRKWRYNNITKIVACLDNQSAYEGDQWENGIFTYYLLRGLRGLADGQEYSTVKPDGIVVVSEIKHYITDWIAKDLSIKLQTPEKEGQDNTVLSIVDSVTLNNLIKKIAIEIPNMQKANPKSFGEHFIKQLSEECQTAYTRFVNNLDLGFMDKAIQDYELLAKITPDQTAKKLIKRELIAGLIDDSYKFLSDYLASDMSKLTLNIRRNEKMVNNLTTVLTLINKSDFRYKSIQAEKLFFMGLYLKHYLNRALPPDNFFENAIIENPNSVYIYNELGAIYLEKKRYTDAINIYNKALELAPDWFYLLAEKGITLTHLGKYEESIQYFDKVLSLRNDIPEIYIEKGLSLFHLKKYNASIENYDKAILLKPNNAFAYNEKGIVLYEIKKYDLAIQCYNQAIVLDKNNADYHYNKGTLFHEIKKYDLAIQCYNQAILLDKNNADYHYNKGVLFHEIKKYDLAIQCYNQAIILDKNNIDCYNAKINLLIELKKYSEAIKLCKQVIILSPFLPETYYNLSCLHSLQNQPKEALSYLEQALQKGYNDFASIKEDTDLDNIRALPAFRELLRKYQK